jgi:hypothetical protein
MGEHVCEVNDILVNSCRPWLGARAAGYPQVGKKFDAQHRYHEQRIGRKLDMVHAFASARELPFTDSGVVDWTTQRESIMVHNWKPARLWRDAAGNTAEVNTRIDTAARIIKQLAPVKVMIVIHHEPENDVSTDPGTRHESHDSSGSAAQYRMMWANIRTRFDNLGVDNVVWAMAYMNYPKWNDLVPQLYPGDDLVDWIMFNGYGSHTRPDLSANINGFLGLLEQYSTPGQQMLTDKPLGIIEWGISKVDPEVAVSYFDQATEILDNDRFPQIKAWMVFDSPGTHADKGLRLGYDDNGDPFPQKMAAYEQFAMHTKFSCPLKDSQ